MNDNTAILLAISLVVLSVWLYSQLGKNRTLAPLSWSEGSTFTRKYHRSTTIPAMDNLREMGRGLRALGKSIIILNDPKHAINMLDKKSRFYSDRPTLVMAGELVGWDQGPALIPFCDTWREYRGLMVQFMGTRSKVEAFGDVLQGETHNFLKRILVDPAAWATHSRKFAGTIVLTLAYGYTTSDEEDRMVTLVNEAMNQFSEITASNAFLVDAFPILRHVPEWCPGAAWKKKASKYRITLQEMVNAPYDWAKQEIAAGTARPSFLSNLLGVGQSTAEEEHVMKWAAAGIYSGGADTSVAGIESFFLAMTLQTSAQQKAQAELDTVLGPGRLPTLDDRARLPYVEALFTEVLRTYTFGPIGLPHVLTEDDIHDGYFIPEGSIIITNVWQFFRDPKTYPNPELFSPERFMATEGGTKETDPREYLFGFGRRTCPGIHLADASMWLSCVSALAAFDIRPPVKDGKPMLPSGKYMDGSISHPEPFECVIKPRPGVADALLRAI